MTHIKKITQNVFNKFGYKVEKIISKDIVYLAEQLVLWNVDTVLDVGANNGQFAELLISQGYSKNIISFEPTMAAHKVLKRKSETQPNWLVFERSAIGDVNGTVEINVSENSVSSSILEINNAHLGVTPSARYCSKETVPVYTLDCIFEKLNMNTLNCNYFVKIDTQGYEMNVLRGCSTMTRYISGFKIELSTQQLYNNSCSYTEIIEFMADIGFVLIDITPGLRHSSGQLLQFDGLFCKKEFAYR